MIYLELGQWTYDSFFSCFRANSLQFTILTSNNDFLFEIDIILPVFDLLRLPMKSRRYTQLSRKIFRIIAASLN